MAERYPGDVAAKNGFGRHWLTAYECRLLHDCGYPAPPDFRCVPSWSLSAGGIPVLDVPEGDELVAEIERVRSTMSEEELADPANHPDNHVSWVVFFKERCKAELAAYDGPSPVPKRKNTAGRNLFWAWKAGLCTHYKKCADL